MAVGPGKYDDIATAAREGAEARGIVVLVFEGKDGSGFSVQGHDVEFLLGLPAVMRDLANQIEADMKRGEL